MIFIHFFYFFVLFTSNKMNNTLLVGISVTGVALLICIISTAIPYWWVSEYANIGLFRSCVTIKGLFNVPPIESCGETNGYV